MPNKEKIEISRIYITLTQPTYMIRTEGELEDLKKKFVNVAINHLREAGKKKIVMKMSLMNYCLN